MKEIKTVIDINNEDINFVYTEISGLINKSRNRVYNIVNVEMLNLYWNIGKIIIDMQEGMIRASYGDAMLEKLSEKLTNEFGKGFSAQNLRKMRQFYISFPIRSSVMNELSWTHYLELIRIRDELKRNFYMKECINSNWSVRELARQINSLLYERLTLSKDRDIVLELSQKGQIFKTSKDLIKDPFVLEFLDIKENTNYLETDLESNILSHLKEFMLELGKGFMFVGS